MRRLWNGSEPDRVELFLMLGFLVLDDLCFEAGKRPDGGTEDGAKENPGRADERPSAGASDCGRDHSEELRLEAPSAFRAEDNLFRGESCFSFHRDAPGSMAACLRGPSIERPSIARAVRSGE